MRDQADEDRLVQEAIEEALDGQTQAPARERSLLPALGCAASLALFAAGCFYLAIGAMGIASKFGTGWAIAAVGVSILMRFTLPIVVGVFLYAMYSWGWHWSIALLFAAPGLIFMVPAVVATIFRRRIRQD